VRARVRVRVWVRVWVQVGVRVKYKVSIRVKVQVMDSRGIRVRWLTLKDGHGFTELGFSEQGQLGPLGGPLRVAQEHLRVRVRVRVRAKTKTTTQKEKQ
jgi:hypothetical protein